MIEKTKNYIKLNGLENICYFSKYTYKEGDLLCLEIEGKDRVYEIYSTPKTQATSIKTYYAKQL